ncbi:stress response translation initiation inhibitor YciH [Colwellia sp. BRX8-7]|jgi:translation initiation factor 1|uniref:translation initiation factor n=1 Tax=unclassified Colwellia TaxID=196834 RepID=UPI0015F40F0A|nr:MULTISPECIES: stress response translation initiation inhibitor YciH [unclassified Colwellia]MBA6339076.1 stress response translation initiation inhibitor YciH [Colwellia sp. BRX8-7]MBA6362381.1 stress response translation initiation inhibitor YciH [Colwellia sp. BRX8-8]MBA6373256.1 stress response translation initiation inhibitor YciH [Colwellia sp. BRX8-4]
MKNKLSSLSDLAGAFGRESATAEHSAKQQPADSSLVYSTDSGRIKQDNNAQTITASDGFAKVRRETKGRKGKGVITISGLGLDAKALKELATKLKKTCGTGGSVVGEVIEVQGDKREQIKQVLESNGFKVKFVGG